jgi:hypothetical protein
MNFILYENFVDVSYYAIILPRRQKHMFALFTCFSKSICELNENKKTYMINKPSIKYYGILFLECSLSKLFHKCLENRCDFNEHAYQTE